MSSINIVGRLRRDESALMRRRAILRDHRLAFEKISSTNPAVGYANVAAAGGHYVEGILNELDDESMAALDRIELVPHHYLRAQMMVTDCVGGREIEAHIYTAHPSWIRPGLKPLRNYVAGLMQGIDILSAEYVARLSEIECYEDVMPKLAAPREQLSA